MISNNNLVVCEVFLEDSISKISKKISVENEIILDFLQNPQENFYIDRIENLQSLKKELFCLRDKEVCLFGRSKNKSLIKKLNKKIDKNIEFIALCAFTEFHNRVLDSKYNLNPHLIGGYLGKELFDCQGKLQKMIDRNNLKNREFSRESPQHSHSERVAIAFGQGASENAHVEGNSTPSKTDSSDCFGIEGNWDKISEKERAVLLECLEQLDYAAKLALEFLAYWVTSEDSASLAKSRANSIVKKIGKLKPGQSILLPGYTDGHVVLYQIVRIDGKEFRFSIVNTGRGWDFKDEIKSSADEHPKCFDFCYRVNKSFLNRSFFKLLFPDFTGANFAYPTIEDMILKIEHSLQGTFERGRQHFIQQKESCASKCVASWLKGELMRLLPEGGRGLSLYRSIKLYFSVLEVDALKQIKLNCKSQKVLQKVLQEKDPEKYEKCLIDLQLAVEEVLEKRRLKSCLQLE